MGETRRLIDMAAREFGAPGTNGTNGRNGHSNGHARGLIVTADVVAERVEWLWPGRLPVGKLVVLDGDPDLGKSTVALDLAARLSVGAPLPDGHRPPGPVPTVVMSAEDGLADTIVPRLLAAGADCTRIHAWQDVPYTDADGEASRRLPSIPADIAELELHIRRTGARLVIIDVLMAYLHEKVNAHHDQDVRRVLMALGGVAQRTRSVILVLRHLNKSGGTKSMYRGGGSIGIVGAARSGLIVGTDPDDESRRILAVVKCNLAVKAKALAYQIESDDFHGCGRVRWLGQTHHTADSLMALPQAEDREAAPRASAEGFLRDLLAEKAMPVQDIKREALSAGLTWRTVRRAQADLGIIPRHVGNPGDPEQWWEWQLPLSMRPQGGQHGPRRPPPRGGHLGHLGHLGTEPETTGSEQMDMEL